MQLTGLPINHDILAIINIMHVATYVANCTAENN